MLFNYQFNEHTWSRFLEHKLRMVILYRWLGEVQCVYPSYTEKGLFYMLDPDAKGVTKPIDMSAPHHSLWKKLLGLEFARASSFQVPAFFNMFLLEMIEKRYPFFKVSAYNGLCYCDRYDEYESDYPAAPVYIRLWQGGNVKSECNIISYFTTDNINYDGMEENDIERELRKVMEDQKVPDSVKFELIEDVLEPINFLKADEGEMKSFYVGAPSVYNLTCELMSIYLSNVFFDIEYDRCKPNGQEYLNRHPVIAALFEKIQAKEQANAWVKQVRQECFPFLPEKMVKGVLYRHLTADELDDEDDADFREEAERLLGTCSHPFKRLYKTQIEFFFSFYIKEEIIEKVDSSLLIEYLKQHHLPYQEEYTEGVYTICVKSYGTSHPNDIFSAEGDITFLKLLLQFCEQFENALGK